MFKKKEKQEKKSVIEAKTFEPSYVVGELKKVSWARLRSTSKENGLFRNFCYVFVFTGLFALFFELCSLVTAGIFKIM